MDAEATIPSVQMSDITRRYPGGIVANDRVSLAAFDREIHGIVGENGAGKTTLMRILYGSVQPEAGRIRLHGEDVAIQSPSRAIALGIGMVSQHTSMIPALAMWENCILGAEHASAGLLAPVQAIASLEASAAQLGVRVDWRQRAADASIATLQKADIVGALHRGARILILDEPTAGLAPAEATVLFDVLHGLCERGTAVLLVTHRIKDVLSHAARVTVLRRGRCAGSRIVSDTTESEVLGLMLGAAAGVGALLRGPADQTAIAGPMDWSAAAPRRAPADRVAQTSLDAEAIAPLPVAPAVPRLELRGVSVAGRRGRSGIRSLTMTVREGEILGVAGVDGSGQRELAQAIVGLIPFSAGQALLEGEPVRRPDVRSRMARGLAYLPEDRLRDGLVQAFTVAENLALSDPTPGLLVDRDALAAREHAAVADYRVAAFDPQAPVSTLSGGNQQKVLVARGLQHDPSVIVALQPTRGLDVAATQSVHNRLLDARARGAAILLFSLDLDEILDLSDRVAVLYAGELAGIVESPDATHDTIGALMMGAGVPGAGDA